MKKKIFIAMTTLFLAAIAFYNVQVSQHNGDISLEHVALMAQANGESGSIVDNCYVVQGAWCNSNGSQKWCIWNGFPGEFCK